MLGVNVARRGSCSLPSMSMVRGRAAHFPSNPVARSRGMPTPYRVVATNLDTESIDEADRITRILKDEGWPRATRSLVVREALDLLRENVSGKSPKQVFRYFIDRRGAR